MACWVNFRYEHVNVKMNMNYSYPTTMYESMLAQMYIFLVLFKKFAVYRENLFLPKLQKYFSTRNMYIRVNKLSYIVVREL